MADMLAGGLNLRKFIFCLSMAFLLVFGQMQTGYWMLQPTFGRRFAAVLQPFGLRQLHPLAYNDMLHWTKTRRM
jgi:hypothetical protein